MINEGVLQGVKVERNILHTVIEGRVPGFITFCVGTAL